MYLNREEFRVVRLIAAGGEGVAFLLSSLTRNKFLVCKVFYSQEEISRVQVEHGSNYLLEECFVSFPSSVCQEFLPFLKIYGKVLDQFSHSFPSEGFGVLSEYFSEGNLEDYVKRHSLTYAEALNIIARVAAGLDYLHCRANKGNGFIHRDVKPGNVFLRSPCSVVLGDFGIALPRNYVGKQKAFGDPFYGARELYPRGGGPCRPCEESDTYSLTLLTCWLLSGELPIPKEFQVAKALPQWHESGKPVRVGLPENIESVIFRGIAKEPEERFSSGRAFFEALLEEVPKNLFDKQLFYQKMLSGSEII